MRQNADSDNSFWSGRRDSVPVADTPNSVLEGEQLGLALKDAALERFEGDPWLVRARAAARDLLQHCDSIIIDDVRAVVGPPPRPNMAWPVFAIGCFEFAGYDRSPRPEGHYNRICRWRLA